MWFKAFMGNHLSMKAGLRFRYASFAPSWHAPTRAQRKFYERFYNVIVDEKIVYRGKLSVEKNGGFKKVIFFLFFWQIFWRSIHLLIMRSALSLMRVVFRYGVYLQRNYGNISYPDSYLFDSLRIALLNRYGIKFLARIRIIYFLFTGKLIKVS